MCAFLNFTYFTLWCLNCIEIVSYSFFSEKFCYNSCFRSVLEQNIERNVAEGWAPQFYDIARALHPAHQFAWPRNNYCGNATGDLIEQYVRNVTTNLNTHTKKRLTQYLKVVIYNHNHNDQSTFLFKENDIKNTVNWAIHQRDSIGDGMDEETEADRDRRDTLLRHLDSDLSWWQIENFDVTRFTKYFWFKSLPFWLNMQRTIDEFNTNEELRLARQQERQENRRRRRRQQYRQRRRLRQQQQQEDQPEQQQQSEKQPQKQKRRKRKPNKDAMQPPKVRNLAVIPICNFQRKHVAVDNYSLYKVICEMFARRSAENEAAAEGKVKAEDQKGEKEKKKAGKSRETISYNQFREHQQWYWDNIFDLPKIRRLAKEKDGSKRKFRFRILSDGVSVSLQFDIKRAKVQSIDMKKIKQQLLDGFFRYIIGIDPGDKTWNATTRRTVASGKEVNLTTSSKRYHWDAQQSKRNKKAKRWTKDYTAEEQRDLNDRTLYPATPSPMSRNWIHYVMHRMKMLTRGMAVYATAKYARLSADKHIWSQRTIDRIAKKLAKDGPTLVFIGNVDMSPNRPIRIKKHVRCPGQRKLLNAFKKLSNCVVI